MGIVNSRLTRLREDMAARGEGLFLVTEAKNRRYLSGFRGSSGWLVVFPDKATLITDGRYWEQVGREAPEVEVFRYQPWQHKSLSGALAALLTKRKPSTPVKLSLEIDDMPVALYREILKMAGESGLTVDDVEGRVKGYRAIKDCEEIACLRRAAEIADRALSAALARFEPGQSEAHLKAELDYQVLLAGGEGASFPTIVASGPQGSFPHAGATDRMVQKHELVTIDFGALWNGYCSDMTRTVWWGALSDRDRLIVREVTRAQGLAVEAARPGISCEQLDEVARASLRQAGLAEQFLHSLGHGVGLDIHEAPSLRSGQEQILEAGQVVTIEPGVYLANETGCRIEDTVVLRDGAPADVLNRSAKQALDEESPP